MYTLETHKNNIICSFGSRSFKWIFHITFLLILYISDGWLREKTHTKVEKSVEAKMNIFVCWHAYADHHIVVVVVWVVCLSCFFYIYIYINIYKLIREKQNFLYLLYIIVVVVPTINLCSEMGENIYNNELKRCGC